MKKKHTLAQTNTNENCVKLSK